MTSKTAAHRYARALFDVALKEQADLRQIDADLAAFAALFTEHDALAKALLNPVVPAPKKRAAVAELTARAGFVSVLAKLLTLLAERDRLAILPDLVEAYGERLRAHLNIVSATITTAEPLDGARVKAMEQKLSAATGRTVALQATVDPSLVGGVVARIGSVVYDGSVTRQLEKIRERLLQGA